MENVRHIGLEEVAKHLKELGDPRSTVNRHPLPSVLVIALLAGPGGPTAIAAWAATQEELLARGARLAPRRPRQGRLPPRPHDPPTEGLPELFS